MTIIKRVLDRALKGNYIALPIPLWWPFLGWPVLVGSLRSRRRHGEAGEALGQQQSRTASERWPSNINKCLVIGEIRISDQSRVFLLSIYQIWYIGLDL